MTAGKIVVGIGNSPSVGLFVDYLSNPESAGGEQLALWAVAFVAPTKSALCVDMLLLSRSDVAGCSREQKADCGWTHFGSRTSYRSAKATTATTTIERQLLGIELLSVSSSARIQTVELLLLLTG